MSVTRRSRLEEEAAFFRLSSCGHRYRRAPAGASPLWHGSCSLALLHLGIFTAACGNLHAPAVLCCSCPPAFTAPCHGTHVTSWTCQRLKKGDHVPQTNRVGIRT